MRVRRLSDDFRAARVEMPLRWFNRNYVGTHFGGSLYSMTDPFLMIMLIRNLGPDYIVWDKSASIESVAPGRGTMVAEFAVDDAMLDALRAATASGEKHLPWFDIDVRDLDGSVVARVRKQVYVRRKDAAKGRVFLKNTDRLPRLGTWLRARLARDRGRSTRLLARRPDAECPRAHEPPREWLFDVTVRGAIQYERAEGDTGVVQRDSLNPFF